MSKTFTYLLLASIFVVSVPLIGYLSKPQKQPVKYIENLSQINGDMDSILSPLGLYLPLTKQEAVNMNCIKERLPTIENKDFPLQAICENKTGSPYLGIFWKKIDYQKVTFQTEIINQFLKNRSTRTGGNETGEFSCIENTDKKYSAKELLRSDCTITIFNSTTTLYTTFMYIYPVEATAFGVNPIIIISSESKNKTESVIEYLFSKLNKTTSLFIPHSTRTTSTSTFLIERAYAGGGGGDGGGAAAADSCSAAAASSAAASCSSDGGSAAGNGGDGNSWIGVGSSVPASDSWGSWVDTTNIVPASPVDANVCSYSTPTWAGSSCVAPVGNITSNACTIPTNSSSCSMNVVWSVTNPPGAVEVRRPYDGNSVMATGATGNAPYVFPYSATPYTLDLYDAHRNEKLDEEQFSATCALGGWDSVSGMCVNPLVTSVTITGQYYSSPGTISFTCSGSNNYIVRNTDTNATSSIGLYSGPRSVSVGPTGNYGVICGYGAYLSNQTVRYYNAPPPPPPVVSLISSPRTLVRDAQTTLIWDIQWPVNACTITAKSVCTNGICNAAQLSSEAALTSKLRTESTDASDPSGVRTINSSIKTFAPGHIDTDWKALGRKTITVANTMDITIDCGSSRKATTRVQVTSSNEQ